MYRNKTSRCAETGHYLGVMTRSGDHRSPPRPARGGHPRGRARPGDAPLPARPARRRAGDRGRARPRAHDDLPLVRIARRADRRGARARGRAAAEGRARAARGRGGPALLDTLDRFNRSLANAPALRRFVEHERDAALRVITSGAGSVQPRIVAMITDLIEDEVSAGAYEPPVEPATLGYAIVRLGEAFLYNDAVAGMRGDVDRLRDVEAAILGVSGTKTDLASRPPGVLIACAARPRCMPAPFALSPLSPAGQGGGRAPRYGALRSPRELSMQRTPRLRTRDRPAW